MCKKRNNYKHVCKQLVILKLNYLNKIENTLSLIIAVIRIVNQ